MKQQGFVLITVVLILSVMTLLVIANMRWVTGYGKRYHDWIQYQDRIGQLEQIGDKLGAEFSDSVASNCFLFNQYDNQLKRIIVQQGCKISEHYRYGVYDLGRYPCIHFSPTLSTHHWLVTVMDTRLPNVLLQLRIGLPVAAEICLDTQIRYVQNRVLTWRMVID